MAEFLGTIQGNRGEVSRTGSKRSGITANIGSWSGGVYVRLWENERTGTTWCRVTLQKWHGSGTEKMLYEGPVSEYLPNGELPNWPK